MSLTRATLCLLALLGSSAALAQGGPHNDTGQVICYDNNASTGTVRGNTPDPETAGFDQQDCTLGRAAADAVGVLFKTGASSVRGRDSNLTSSEGPLGSWARDPQSGSAMAPLSARSKTPERRQ